MLFTHSRPFTEVVEHTFCEFHTVQSPQLTLHEFIAVKTISASHYPETDKPLSGITIADLCQTAVTRFLSFVLTCLDSHMAGVHCTGMIYNVIVMTWTQIRPLELWQRPFHKV